MRLKGFIGPSYQMRSINVDCQRTVNLYAEMDETGLAAEGEIGSLIGTPGLKLWGSNWSSLPMRAIYTASNGSCYFVNGNTVYHIVGFSNATISLVGTINSQSGPVSIADNGTSLFLVDGTDGWYWQLNFDGNLTQVTDPTWGGANQVVFQDGYFIFNKPSTNGFFTSDLLATTFTASSGVLALGAKGSNPDPIVAILSDHRNLWLFGSETTEVWFDSGNPPPGVAFSQIQGGFIELGCAATFSVSKMNNAVFFLGKDQRGQGIVYALQGFMPQRISTHAVELALQSYGDLSGAVAYGYQSDGHQFYVLNVPGANTTWVYDMTTGQWHERCFNNQGTLDRHLAQVHAYANNTHFVGDYQTGNIYTMSSEQFTDNGTAIIRQRIAPHLTQDMTRIFYSQFQLDLEPGVGIDGSGQGINPQAVLTFSDDGAHTWSNEKWTNIGAIGQTKWRAIWRRLGQARDRVFKVTISDPVKVVMIGAEIFLSPGES